MANAGDRRATSQPAAASHRGRNRGCWQRDRQSMQKNSRSKAEGGVSSRRVGGASTRGLGRSGASQPQREVGSKPATAGGCVATIGAEPQVTKFRVGNLI